MKTLAFIGGCLLLCGTASAQANVGASSHLAFDQVAPDLSTVQTYTFKHYDDGGMGIGFPASQLVVVESGTVFTITVPFPPFSPGRHTIIITASNSVGESAPSPPFTFTFVVVPSAPTNLRIVMIPSAVLDIERG